jgi:hypothetical protein
VDLATIAAARHRQEAARILRDEVCNRSDDGNPPLELSERTEQILASRDWLLADEVGELSRRSRCAENRKSVLIRYANLDPTQYGEADAGGRRRAGRLLAREKHCRSWLSKIICGVIFYESRGKADAPAPARRR